jgi:hypothetical protein
MNATVAPAQAQQAPNVTPSTTAPLPPKGVAPFTLGTKVATEHLSYIKMLIYAPPGFGKTTLVGTAADVPQMGECLYIDCEGGELALVRSQYIKNWESLIRNRVRVNSFMEIGRIHEFLTAYVNLRAKGNEQGLIANEALVRGIDPSEIKVPTIFNTVILDTLTEAEQYNLNMLTGYDAMKPIVATDADEVEVASWPIFRKNKLMVEQLIRSFRDLPMNVLVTAHEKYSQDEVKRYHYGPSLTGQLVGAIQGKFDIVGPIRKVLDQQGKLERRLYVNTIVGEKFDAKCRRSSFTADFFPNPTMNSIMQGIGLLKPTSPPAQAETQAPKAA